MFPMLYDAHHNRNSEDLPFWLELAKQHGGPVLELGCGTGRVLLFLARAGHDVVGLDNDLGMLKWLQEHLEPTLLPFTLIFAADLQAFHLAAHFPLIILPCNTWSTLSAPTRRAALICIRQHLAPSGCFAVAIPNPVLLVSLPARGDAEPEDEFLHPLTGDPVQVSSGWQRTRRQFIVDWHYDHLIPDGSVRRLTTHVRHELTSAETYLQELRAAGLDVTGIFGDFERSPFASDSPSLVILAQNSD